MVQKRKLKFLKKRLAQELTVANCALHRTSTKTAMSFPSVRCGLHIFHWWSCV